jgi:hypothetical protein
MHIQDPGWKNSNPGSGSATLFSRFKYLEVKFYSLI